MKLESKDRAATACGIGFDEKKCFGVVGRVAR